MTSTRRQLSDVDPDAATETVPAELPDLNSYEIHADRIVFTEPDNTEGWIAIDETVPVRK